MKIPFLYQLSKLFQATFVARVFLLPSALLLLYSVILATLTRSIVDKANVNLEFLEDITNISLAGLIVSGLFFVLLSFRSSTLKLTPVSRTLSITTYLMVALLSISPLVRYFIANRDIMTIVDMAIISLIFFSLAVVLIVVIPFLLSRYSLDKLLLSVAGALTFTLLNMASISQIFHWLVEGKTIIQLGLFTFAIVATWFLVRLKKNDLVFFVVVFIAGSALVQFIADGDEEVIEVSATSSSIVEFASEMDPKHTPNIYLLVYDSYVPNETMLSYGIDNSDQEHYLIEQGFTLYPHTYSVGSSSLRTMNRVLDISTEINGRNGVAGNGNSQELFRALDYQILGLFSTDYFFRGLPEEPNYDYYTPNTTIVLPTYQMLSTGILMGEFRFDLALPSIPHEEYVAGKEEIFARKSEKPQFIYTHSLLPSHSQTSGVCRTNEVSLFAERLQAANEEMKQDIEIILDNDHNAIIIVAGDHGPYLTKNCTGLRNEYQPSEVDRLDLQDRFGTFLAIRWPSDNYVEFDQITVLQDILPAILAWMYEDQSLLDMKIPPVTLLDSSTAGVNVDNGVIIGGIHDGEPLYLSPIPSSESRISENTRPGNR